MTLYRHYLGFDPNPWCDGLLATETFWLLEKLEKIIPNIAVISLSGIFIAQILGECLRILSEMLWSHASTKLAWISSISHICTACIDIFLV